MRGYAHKHKVLALVDRITGKARSMVVNDLKAKTLVPILKENKVSWSGSSVSMRTWVC